MRTSPRRLLSRSSRHAFITALAAAIAVAGCTTEDAQAAKRKTTKAAKRTTKKSAGGVVIVKPPSTTAAAANSASRTPNPPAESSLPAGEANTCRPIRIMPLGDSLTAFSESYRGPLFRTLMAQGRQIDFVGSVRWDPSGGGDPDGEGHGGFTIGPDSQKDGQGNSTNIAANLDRWLTAAKPDIVLLTIGTNDLAGGGEFTSQAPAKLKALVATLQASLPNGVIAVGDVPPSIYTPNNPAAFNAMTQAAKALGDASDSDRAIYAPTVKRLNDLGFTPEKDTTDGVHFTVAGGEMFAKAWLPSVDEAFRRLPNLC